METWNQRLARAIAESEYTPNAIATKLGVSAPTVAAWIGAGTIQPAKDITARNLFGVCTLINVTPEWVLLRKGAKKATDGANPVGPSVNTHDKQVEIAVRESEGATVEEMKREINTAIADEVLSEDLLLAVYHIIRAGMRAPAQGDQHHTKTVKLRDARGPVRKSTRKG